MVHEPCSPIQSLAKGQRCVSSVTQNAIFEIWYNIIICPDIQPQTEQQCIESPSIEFNDQARVPSIPALTTIIRWILVLWTAGFLVQCIIWHGERRLV